MHCKDQNTEKNTSIKMESGTIMRQQEDLDPEDLTMRQSVVDREKLKVSLKG